MKIKEISKENRPRERLLKYGPESLSDAELLAIILRTGSKGENVIDMSNKLITEYGLEGLRTCSIRELQKIKGIGKAKAMQIISINELTKRQLLESNSLKKVTCSKEVFELFNERLKTEFQENFIILMLNSQNYVIGEQLITKGILDASIIHPREVFKPAIKNSAAKIILVHNHPSGDSTPSKEDLEVYKFLFEQGETLGIRILDSIVIGKDNFTSLKENRD